MDGSKTETVTLTASESLNNYAVTYPPKDVRFHIQTLAGSSLSQTCVTALAYQTTLGSYEYVATLFGYNLVKVPVLNQTLSGLTDSRGDITFAMMADVQYLMTFTKTGYTFEDVTITPHDDNYIIYPVTIGSLFVVNGTAPSASVTYMIQSTRINSTTATINISYVDVEGATTSGNINLHRTNKSGTATPDMGVNLSSSFTGNATYKNFTIYDVATPYCPQSTSTIIIGGTATCYNQTNVEDTSYMAQSTGYTPQGTVNNVGTTWFRRTVNPIAGLSPEFALFIALGIMMFTALMAGTSTAPAVSLVVVFEGWVFWGMNMFAIIDPPIVRAPGAITLTAVEAMLTLLTFFCVLWLFVEFRRKGK
jgi:hypothetical protein